MIIKDRVIEFICIVDESDKNLNVELGKKYVNLLIMGMGNVAEIVREDLARMKS